MRLATVFSGIGAPEYTLKKYFPSLNTNIVFACDCGESKPLTAEEVDKLKAIKDPKERQDAVKKEYSNKRKRNWIKETYFSNYACLGITEDSWHDDIRFIDGNQYRDSVDLFIGGSPCQSFSNMGKRLGLEDARGTLFYDYARLIKEIKPKVFIYENVPGMLARDDGQTWKTIKNIFKTLGYGINYRVINAADYGIPQLRKRLFVVGFLDELYSEKFLFPSPFELATTAFDYYDNIVPPKYFMGKKGFEFVTTHNGRAKINGNVIRTEKRNQEFNWNGDFRFISEEVLPKAQVLPPNAYLGNYNGVFGYIRKLTPRECFRLMGFQDDFIMCENDTESYMQAGNSIVVDVLKSLIEAILNTGLPL